MPATPRSANKIHRQIQAVPAAANFDYLQEVVLLSCKARDERVARGFACTINPGSSTNGMNLQPGIEGRLLRQCLLGC